MSIKALLNVILDDENLTRGLGDAEARVLIEWLVAWAERNHEAGAELDEAAIRHVCRRTRALSRFVSLWCYQEARGAALQLAASERFPWPLPVDDTDPCDLMVHILAWEEAHGKMSRVTRAA